MRLTTRGWMVLIFAWIAITGTIGWFAMDWLELASYAAYEQFGITLPFYPNL